MIEVPLTAFEGKTLEIVDVMPNMINLIFTDGSVASFVAASKVEHRGKRGESQYAVISVTALTLETE